MWQACNAAGLVGSVISTSTDGGSTWSTPTPLNRLTGDDVRTFLPTVSVNADGTVGVLFCDFRNDTLRDAELSTDVHLAMFDPGLVFRGEKRLTPASFDMRQMVLTGDRGYFPDDYVGLDAVGVDFVAAFTVANDLGLPVDFPQPPGLHVDDDNRQDIVCVRVCPVACSVLDRSSRVRSGTERRFAREARGQPTFRRPSMRTVFGGAKPSFTYATFRSRSPNFALFRPPDMRILFMLTAASCPAPVLTEFHLALGHAFRAGTRGDSMLVIHRREPRVLRHQVPRRRARARAAGPRARRAERGRGDGGRARGGRAGPSREVTTRVAIVDTNVPVAGLITSRADSPVARVLDGMLGARFPFALSEALLAEYRTVLARPKLRGTPAQFLESETSGL